MDDLRAHIEHTLLAPIATASDVRRAAEAAVAADLKGLCVAPPWVSEARRVVTGTTVTLVTVAGFPTGAHGSEVKAFEAARAVEEGALEVDMVADLSAIADRAWARLARDVAMVARAIRPHPLKVILETARFDAGRTVSAARAAVDGGAAFVKTSTGFDPAGGATIDAVARLRRAVGPSFGVKASGGIRTAEQARAMIAAGATRIGTSRGPALLGGTSRTPE